MTIYVDTSALTKRYVPEEGSIKFEEFVQSPSDALILTPLSVAELHSVLARRLRMKDITAAYFAQAQAFFASDLQHAVWSVQSFPYAAFARAIRLLKDPSIALATLDAMHLASALEFSCDAFATADKQLARAAAASGLAVHTFA